MAEYFVVAESFAAPFVSDRSETFAQGETPESALIAFAENYKHPAGLYAAGLYADANAYHKGAEPLAQWFCNHELEKRKLTESLAGYSYLRHGPGDFEINGVRHRIKDPKGGKLLAQEQG